MNRRNFIGSLITATAGFSVLPGAGRLWRVQRKSIVPFWVETVRCSSYTDEAYNCVIQEVAPRVVTSETVRIQTTAGELRKLGITVGEFFSGKPLDRIYESWER